jgi:hypothetical protein
MALSLALFLSTVGLAGLATTLGSSRNRSSGSEREVREISSRFATALLSYDYRNLAPAKANILALSTPSLQARYEREFPQLAQQLTQGQIRAAAKVTRVYLGPMTANSATTIVVANAAQESKTGVRAAVASYIQLDLAKVSGKWFVNQVTPVKNGDPANLEPVGATTTTAK